MIPLDLLFFSENDLVIQIFVVHINFRIAFSSYINNTIGILIEIAVSYVGQYGHFNLC